MALRVHPSGATGILDHIRLGDQETVPNAHIREGVLLALLPVRGRDVAFNCQHTAIVQQDNWFSQGAVFRALVTTQRGLVIFFFSKKGPRAIFISISLLK